MASYQRYRMFRACEQNNLRLLQNMFKQKLKKDKAFVQKTVCEKKDGLTPLIRACRRGNIKVVRYLVSVCGADIHQVADWSAFYHDMQGASPLLCAVVSGHLRIVKFLIRAGADVNSTSHPRWMPLRAATYLGYLDIVKVLLDNGADLELATWHCDPHPVVKWTHRHDDIISLLSTKSDESDTKSECFAHKMYCFSIQDKRGSVLPYYLTEMSDMLVDHFQLILSEIGIDRAMNCMDYLLRCLIAEGRRIDGKFRNDVHAVLLFRFWLYREDLAEDTIEKFRKHYYDLVALEQQRDLEDETMLEYVIENIDGNFSPDNITDMAQFLLEVGANVNTHDPESGDTPLHAAAWTWPFNAQLVDLLIHNGAHIDLVNSDNNTAMDFQPRDDESVSELRYPERHQTLQCLAARAVCKHNVPYKGKDVTQPSIEAIEQHKRHEQH